MPQHRIDVVVDLPEDGPTMADLRAAARALGLGLDGFVARALVLLERETRREAADPRVQAWLEQPPSGRASLLDSI